MNLRKLAACAMLQLPSFLKVAFFRLLFRYEIGADVKIGFTLLFPKRCRIGRGTRIGHFNYIGGMQHLDIGESARIGHFNIILGGLGVTLGDGAFINRFNEINSILNPLVRGTPDARLVLGRRAVVTAWHKIDFTDRVTLGDSVVLAGRLSNLWTHNRQDCMPVEIGEHCYVGSGIQMVPGSAIGAHCVVGLGSIITRRFADEGVLIAGVPAKVIKPLDEATLRLVTFPTRTDLDGAADLDGPAGAGGPA